jgi:hypothetical protein
MPKTTLLDQQSILIKERSGLLAGTDTCDLLDPANLRAVGMVAHESAPLSNRLRGVVGPGMVTTVLNVYDPGVSLPILSVRKKAALKGGRLEIRGVGEQVYATARMETWSLGAGFDFADGFGHRLGSMKGDWKHGTFTFNLLGGKILGVVTRPDTGRGAAVTVSLHPECDHPRGMALLLGAALALDMAARTRR